jgi:hypothetical protein
LGDGRVAFALRGKPRCLGRHEHCLGGIACRRATRSEPAHRRANRAITRTTNCATTVGHAATVTSCLSARGAEAFHGGFDPAFGRQRLHFYRALPIGPRARKRTALTAQAQAQAKKLTAHMGRPEPTSAALVKDFEQKSGVATTFLRLSAGEAVNRIRAERARPQASVLYGIGLPSMMPLKSEGLLQPYKPKGIEDIPAKYVDPEGYWTGIGVDFSSRQRLARRATRTTSSFPASPR